MKKHTTSLQVTEIAHRMGYRITKNGTVLDPNGKIMLVEQYSKGYPYFRVQFSETDRKRHNMSSHHVFIHQLACLQKFGGLYTLVGMMSRHLDGNKENVKLDNIGIGTAMDNFMDELRLSGKLFIPSCEYGNLLSSYSLIASYLKVSKDELFLLEEKYGKMPFIRGGYNTVEVWLWYEKTNPSSSSQLKALGL